MRQLTQIVTEGSALVGTGYNTIATWMTGGLVDKMNAAVQIGTGALADFKMQLLEHGGSNLWFDYISGTQWGATNSSLLYVGTANPATLSANNTTNFHAAVGCPDGIRFLARGTAGTPVSLWVRGCDE